MRCFGFFGIALKYCLINLYQYCFVYTLALAIVFAEVSLEAETYSYCGINFNLTSLKAVDTENLLISDGKQEVLISKSSLGSWLVNNSFVSQSELDLLPSPELFNYLERCPQIEGLDLEVRFLNNLLKREHSEFDWSKFLHRGPAAITVLKLFLKNFDWNQAYQNLSMKQIVFMTEAFLNLLLQEPEWTKQNLLKPLHLLGPSLDIALQDKIAQSVIDENPFQIQTILKVLDLGIEGISITLREQAELALQILRLLPAATSCKDFRPIQIIQQRSSDVILQKYRDLIVSSAQELLKQNKMEQALECVSMLSPKISSPQTFKLISALLNGLLENGRQGLFLDNIRPILNLHAQAEPELKQQYLKMLSQESEEIMQKGDLDLALIRLAEVESLDSKVAQELALKLSDLAKGSNQNLIAEVLLGRVGNRSLETEPKSLYFLSGLLLLVLLGSLVFFRTKVRSFFNRLLEFALSLVTDKSEVSIPEEDSEPSKIKSKSFVKFNVRRQLNLESKEYIACLKHFGLTETATLKEIKSAYRNAVKSCHPDLNPEQSEQDRISFIFLTKTYERILELKLFLDSAKE